MKNNLMKFIKSKYIFFIILFLVVVNLLIQGYFIYKIDFISPQDTGLLNIARKIISSDTFTEAEQELMEPYKIYPPIYSAICGIIYFFTGDLDSAPKIYHIIFSGALIVPIFLISLRFYGKETAVISSLLLTFLPALSTTIYYSVRHVSFIFFLYLGLYFIFAGYLKNKIKYYGFGGFSLGLTYLVRQEALVIVFVVLLAIVLKGLLEKNKQYKDIFKKASVFICLFLPLFLFSSVYAYNSTGKWSIGGDKKWKYDHFMTGQGIIDGVSNNVIEHGYKVYGSAEENNNSILTAIKKNPKAYISRVIKNFKMLMDALPSPAVIPFYLYLFMGIALFELLGNSEQMKRSIIFIATVISLILLWIIVFFVQAKNLVPIVPVFAVWIAHGIRLIQDKIRVKNPKKLFVYLPSIVTVLSLAIIFVTYTEAISRDIPRETKVIGEWIKSNSSVSDLVIVPKEWFDERFYLQYYSKRRVRNEFPENLKFLDNFINERTILIVKKDKVNLFNNKKMIPKELNKFNMKGKEIRVYTLDYFEQ